MDNSQSTVQISLDIPIAVFAACQKWQTRGAAATLEALCIDALVKHIEWLDENNEIIDLSVFSSIVDAKDQIAERETPCPSDDPQNWLGIPSVLTRTFSLESVVAG